MIDKLPDAANVGVGALFFGQFLSDRMFSILVALFGVGIWLLLIAWSVVLAGKEES